MGHRTHEQEFRTRYHFHFLALACICCASVGCQARQGQVVSPERPFMNAAVAQAGTPRMLERIEAATWTLELTERKQVVGDLLVLCEGDLVVDGVIEGLDRPAGDEHPDGATIHLVSRTRIIIRGAAAAGRGGDAHAGPATLENCRLPGGRGGDVILEAPLVYLGGDALAGDGGRAGANAAAPAGGDVVIRGHVIPDRLDGGLASSRLMGGRGGGFLGAPFVDAPADGRGGAGGTVRLEGWDAAAWDAARARLAR